MLGKIAKKISTIKNSFLYSVEDSNRYSKVSHKLTDIKYYHLDYADTNFPSFCFADYPFLKTNALPYGDIIIREHCGMTYIPHLESLSMDNVFLCNNHSTVNTIRMVKRFVVRKPNLNYTRLKPLSIKTNSCFFIYRHMWKGYAHCISEYLPKLIIIREYCRSNNIEPVLVSGSKISETEKQIISLVFNDTNVRLEDYSSTSSLSFNHIHSVDMPTPAGTLAVHPWIKGQIKRKLYNIKAQNNSKLLYIPRSNDARGRYLLNEEAVSSLLSKYGFTKVYLEKLDLDTKIQLFKNAEIVIGPSGAGFSHLIFADNPKVIEILPYQKIPIHNYTLSLSLGLEYHPIFNDIKNSATRGAYYKPILVNIEELKKTLDKVMSK